jgi:hypothetical protein
MAPFLPLQALVFRRVFEFPGRYTNCVPGIYRYAVWRHIVTFWLWVICALWAVSIVNQLTLRCGLPPRVAPINQWGLSGQINPPWAAWSATAASAASLTSRPGLHPRVDPQTPLAGRRLRAGVSNVVSARRALT